MEDDDALLVNNRVTHFTGYFKRHLLYLFLFPILACLPYLAYQYSFGGGHGDGNEEGGPVWYFLSFYDWTLFATSNIIALLLISFMVRILQDICVQVTPRRHFYIVRVLRRSRTKIILSFYFIVALIILDIYTPSQCKETANETSHVRRNVFTSRPIQDPILSPLMEPFGFSTTSKGFLFENENLKENREKRESDENDKGSSCIYTFSIAKKLIKCALVTLIGLSLSKILVMSASILYQDQVYRDRILLNRYHLFVTHLLFSVCRFEGAKKGLLYVPANVSPKRPRSAFYSPMDSFREESEEEGEEDEDNAGTGNGNDDEELCNLSQDSIDEDEDEEEGYYHFDRDDDEDNLLSPSAASSTNHQPIRPVTIPVIQAKGLVRALRGLFGVTNAPMGSESFSSTAAAAAATESRLLTERDWVNFSTFKKNVGVFGPDFSLMLARETSSSDVGLPISECKKRGKFVFDVLTHGKKSSTDPSQQGHATSKSDGESLLPSGYYSKDLLLPPLHQGDFFRLFVSKEAASEIYSVFDLNLDGNITRSELKQVFVQVHKDYRNLIRSVSSSAEALRALDMVLGVSTSLVLLLIYGIIWGANVSSILTLTLSFILALNVVIGDWAKNAFDSLMFLFVCHPFDIGDEVTVEGDPKRYVVSRVYVLKTAMRDSTGVEVYMPNPVLLRKNITNWKRSNEQWEQVTLNLGCDTTEEQIYAFRARLTEFLKRQGKHLFHGTFEPDFTPIIGDNLDVLILKFRVPCKLTLDTRRQVERHRLLQNYIRGDLENLGITYYPRGPSSSPLTFSKERSSFLKAFSKAARKDPLLAEDAAGITFAMNLFPQHSGKT